MYEQSQRYSRTKMVLPLRVWLDEQVGENTPWVWAHTVDTSDIGCRIGGLRNELSPGQVVTIQRGQHKAPFRVIWSKQLGPNENHAGIEAADEKMNLWAVNPSPTPDAVVLSDGVAVFPRSTSQQVMQNGSHNFPGNTTQRNAVPRAAAASSAAPRSSISRLAPSTITGEQKTLLAAAQRRLRWGLSLGFLIVSLMLGLSLYHQVFSETGSLQIEPLLPSPPTARDLARLTPKSHILPASLTKPLDESISRMQIAEAPTGRIVYPVPPNQSVSGKVRLEIVIAANGLVKQIHVLSGKQPLAEAAAEAVRFWHYGTTKGSDLAAERKTNVTVSFLGGDAVSLQFASANPQVENSRPKNN